MPPEVRGNWFSIVPKRDGILKIDTAEILFKHHIAVYRNSCADLECVGHIFSLIYVYVNPFASTTWQGYAGTQYYILLTGQSLSSEVGDISTTFEVGSKM